MAMGTNGTKKAKKDNEPQFKYLNGMKTFDIQPMLDSLDFLELKEKALEQVYHKAIKAMELCEEFNPGTAKLASFVALKKALKAAKKYV